MRSDLSRRSLLTAFVIAAGGTIAGGRRAGAVPPPEETGLSSEGLLAGHPGFQPRTAMPLPHPELPGFLSREQLARHHAEYVHAVEALRQCADITLTEPGTAGLRRLCVSLVRHDLADLLEVTPARA